MHSQTFFSSFVITNIIFFIIEIVTQYKLLIFFINLYKVILNYKFIFMYYYIFQ